MGQRGLLDVAVTAPRGALSVLTVTLEQGGQSTPLFSMTVITTFGALLLAAGAWAVTQER